MPGPLVAAAVPFAIEAGGSILSSIFQSNAQDRAIRALASGVKQAEGTLRGEFGKTEQGLKPYTEGGAAAFSDIASKQQSGYYNKPFDPAMMGLDPGVQFRLDEAQKGLERSAAARGRTYSGGTLRSLAELNQALASQEYGEAYKRHRGELADDFNRGFALGGVGFQGESQLGGLRQDLGTRVADLQTTLASGKAKRNIGQGQIFSDLTSSLSDIGTDFVGTDSFKDWFKGIGSGGKNNSTGMALEGVLNTDIG